MDMLFDDELEEPPDDPTQTPRRGGDETIIGWCRHPDFYSDEIVYEEHVHSSAHRHEARPYVQLDPLVGPPTDKFPKGEPLLGTYTLKKAWECLKRNVVLAAAIAFSTRTKQYIRNFVVVFVLVVVVVFVVAVVAAVVVDLRWVESDGNVAHSATHEEKSRRTERIDHGR